MRKSRRRCRAWQRVKARGGLVRRCASYRPVRRRRRGLSSNRGSTCVAEQLVYSPYYGHPVKRCAAFSTAATSRSALAPYVASPPIFTSVAISRPKSRGFIRPQFSRRLPPSLFSRFALATLFGNRRIAMRPTPAPPPPVPKPTKPVRPKKPRSKTRTGALLP